MRKAALPASCCLMTAVIVFYAGLLPLSRWQPDDYLTIGFMRDFGWAFYQHWYLTWSPRLVSNLLFIAYGAVVNLTHHAWAGGCMALLWAGLAVACVGPSLGRGRADAGGVLLGLAMFAAFLAGHGDSEVFYWPAGGLSYIPTLAASCWLFWLCTEERPGDLRWQASAAAALVLLGGSSEVGVMLALAICAAVAAVRIRRGARALAWLVPGLVISLLDLALVLHGRVGKFEGGAATSPYAHHALASLLAAGPRLAREIVSPPYETSGAGQALGTLAARVLLLAGARWLAPSPDRSGARTLLVPFACALVLGAFATIASAYYQFGLVCCDRHETLRACFLTLALISLGVWSARAFPRRTVPDRAGAVAAACAILLLFVPALPAILHDYETMPAALRAQAATWSSGRATGTEMIFVAAPGGQIVGGAGFMPGTYRVEARDLPWNDYAVLLFFRKKTLVIQ